MKIIEQKYYTKGKQSNNIPSHPDGYAHEHEDIQELSESHGVK